MMSQPDDADRWVGTVLFTGLGPSVEADRHRTTCPYHALQTIHLSTFLGPLFSNSSFCVFMCSTLKNVYLNYFNLWTFPL